MKKSKKIWGIKAMRIMLACIALIILPACGNAGRSGPDDAPDPASADFMDLDTVSANDIGPVESMTDTAASPEVGSNADDDIAPDIDASPDAGSGADSDVDSSVGSYIDEIYWIIENDKQTTFGTVVITGGSVNVRSGSGIEASILGRVSEGTILALLQSGEENGFYRVSYVGNPGYVSAEFSELTSGDGLNVASSGEKLIALTFDDGPHSIQTPLLLDILNEQGAYVTFFVLGASARAHPDIVRRAAEEGHEIGSHAWSHADLTTLSPENLMSEIVSTADIIEQITSSRPLVTRPPYGSYNDAVLEAMDTPVIMWSVDPMDWRFRDADTVYQNVVNVAKDGDIILLHDVNNASVQAAERIIVDLKSRGFTFVTVSELIARRGNDSQSVYKSLRP